MRQILQIIIIRLIELIEDGLLLFIIEKLIKSHYISNNITSKISPNQDQELFKDEIGIKNNVKGSLYFKVEVGTFSRFAASEDAVIRGLRILLKLFQLRVIKTSPRVFD